MLEKLNLNYFGGGLRYALFKVLPVTFDDYEGCAAYDENGNEVDFGYSGYYTVPLFGVVAFQRSDSTLQFRW